MTQNEKGRPSVSGTQDGRGKQKGQTSILIVRQSGYPVNGIFPCRFHREVFNLLEQPITLEQIATITGSSFDRVRLALNDLMASGVVIKRLSGGVC